MVVNLWRYRSFIVRNAASEVRYRYAGSAAGILWHVINPLAQITIYTLVFSRLMEVRLPGTVAAGAFALYLCAGLLPWTAFSDCVLRGAGAFIDNAAYLKKLPIPEQVFVAQTAVTATISLGISMALLLGVTVAIGGAPSPAWLGVPVVLVLLCPTVVECYFTLSKPEVPLALGLAVSLWGWARARAASERTPSRSRRWLTISAAALFVAYFSKETAQAMALVSGLWLVASWKTAETAPAAARVDRWYFGVNLAWTALFWIMRMGAGTVAIGAGGDSQRYAVTGQSIVSSALGHLVWYARDFPLLLPLLIFLAWPCARPADRGRWLAVVAVLWILGWTLIMLPWPTVFEYYLLPASLAVAVITGLGMSAAFRALRAPQASVRAGAGVLLALALVSVPVTLANAATTARIQLAVDGGNSSLVDVLAAQSLPWSTVLVDLPAPNEYVDELRLHLAILKGREDVVVEHLDRGWPARGGGSFLIARPLMQNRPLPGVRIPVPEAAPMHEPIEAQRRYGVPVVLVHRVIARLRLLVTPVPASLCPIFKRLEAHPELFCGAGRWPFDRRPFRYGWEVYRADGR